MARKKLSDIRKQMNRGKKTSVKDLRRKRNLGNNNVKGGRVNHKATGGRVSRSNNTVVNPKHHWSGGHQCGPGEYVCWRGGKNYSGTGMGGFETQDSEQPTSEWTEWGYWSCCDRITMKKGGRVKRSRKRARRRGR